MYQKSNVHEIVQEFANSCDTKRHVTANNLYNFQKRNNNINVVANMKLSVVLETRRKKANGKFPVKIRFNFLAQAYYVSTGVEVFEANFMLGKIVGMPKATMLNNIITQKLDYTQSVLDDLQIRGLLKTKFKTGTEIKQFIESGTDGYDELDHDARMKLHFKTYTENFQKKYSSKKSADQYKFVLNKIEAFCGTEFLFIPDLTVAWLKDFDTYCQNTGMSVNGRGNYLRAIRTIFNDAIDRELIGYDKYPFRRFKIKKTDTKHRNMALSDIQYLMWYDCSKAPHLARYRDVFMLSFFLCGMNIKDLLFLKHTDVRNGYLSIMREKTNVPILLKIEPEAMEIINRYRGVKYLLNFMDTYKNFDDFRRKINLNIKLILPYVTVYWARHSWATVASELDIPDATIDIAMGHKVQGMAGIYINRNLKKVSEANRKVIDYINEKNTEQIDTNLK